MKLVINYPEEENVKLLLNNISKFHSVLLIDYIDSLNLNDDVKKEVLKSTLEMVKNKEKNTR